MKIGESGIIESLRQGTSYKFLGVLENAKQENSEVLQSAWKV